MNSAVDTSASATANCDDFESDFNPIHLATLSTPPRRLTPGAALLLLQQIRIVFERYVTGDPLRSNLNGNADAALKQMQRVCSPWLIRLLDRSSEWEENEETEQVVGVLSDLMAQLCGRTATAKVIRTWRFKSTELVIQEPSFSEADIGFQTWGAGVLLAQLIDEGAVNVKDKVVLELGSGTGVTGLLCAKAGAKLTILTDYHPAVLENAKENIVRNQLSSEAQVHALDWRWVASSSPTAVTSEDQFPHPPRSFELIIAADCIFEAEHAKLVPMVVDRYLSLTPKSEFIVVLPLRERWKVEFADFESNMLQRFRLEEKKHLNREEDPNMDYIMLIYRR